ncbi:MAG: restriction endonuclease subunit S [Gemmatimonadales bacterium]|nr:restriction endonuclease subunit S [Gemmatimonadales bacterium]
MSLVPYGEYIPISLPNVPRLPVGWRLTPLKTVTSCNPEVLPETTAPDHEIEYIDIASVDGMEGIASTQRLVFADAPSRARRLVRRGDVIISTVRTYLKAVMRIDHVSSNLIASTGFAVLRPKAGVESAFLGWALQADTFLCDVIARSTGVSYPSITSSELISLPLPLPDPATQRVIAAFLDRETAKIDALIAEQERLIALLQEKRQAVISHAVTKGLDRSVPMKESGVLSIGPVPAHWSTFRLSRLFRLAKRQNHPEERVLSVYRDFGVIAKDARDDNMNKTPDDLSVYQLVEHGDLVINKMKAWQGSLGISQLRGITSPDYAVFRPMHSSNELFLHLLLRCRSMVASYLSISNGVRLAQWRIEPDQFLGLTVHLPPIDEQGLIASFVSTVETRCEALVGDATAAVALLRERRSALITAAVTGQIDVRGLVEVPG